MPDLPIRTLGSRVVFEHPPWYSLREDRILLPDGAEDRYVVVARPGAVWIVPMLADGRVVLIHNYRHTVQKWLWEIPAGGLKGGVSVEEMARQELAEEIGGTASRLELVATFYTMPGIGDELAHVFLARDVTLGEPRHEPTEIMERRVFTLDETLAMIHSGQMADGPSALSILLCLPLLRG